MTRTTRAALAAALALAVLGAAPRAVGADAPAAAAAARAKAPSFAPAAGTYGSTQQVTISSATPGASIFYTRDGSKPTTASTPYTGPVTVKKDTTLKAIAAKAGETDSAVAIARYTIAPEAGRFPVRFVNGTHGQWRDDQVWIYALGMDAAGRWCHLLADGTMLPMDRADEDAPGHLVKNGRNYAAYAFPLSQAAAFRMPATITGGRFYVSVGSPMYIALGDNGWAGPDIQNPADPNQDVVFDWIEFTWDYGRIPFGGNTTQVEQFGLPMTMRLQSAASGYDRTVGITKSRADVFAGYSSTVGSAFRPLAGTQRITSPGKGTFRPGQPQQDYFQPAIDDTWNWYATHPFEYHLLLDVFTGGVVDGRLRFFKNGVGPSYISKPDTYDVVACTGTLATGSDDEKQLEAQLCAALNRGVATDTTKWLSAPSYYPAATLHNDYAAYLHQVGLLGRAYALSYDDVNDQSTVEILTDPLSPPDALTITVGW